jgi:hypothetical protein
MPNLQPMGIKAVAEGVGQFNQKVGSMNKSINANNKALTKTEKTAAVFRKVMIGVGAAVGVATVAMIGMKKAFDFGREGALITQTGESFDFLIKKIGASTDLLEQLTSASRGTISEMELMTSTATLLAGAGDELAKKLADATPQLLEIAKAANKLNPALGSTAFLYQSIATGVKRAQPLILDNLGITIKVGDANEKFAKSIGKTVAELTAEEKAMAILLGTLEAGDNLIQQVGGSVDSATDSFDRLGVGVTTAGDRLKKAVFTAIEPAVDSLADMFEEVNELNDIMETFGVKVSRSYAGGFEFAGRAIGKTNKEVIAWAESMNRATAQADQLMFAVAGIQPIVPIEIQVDPPIDEVKEKFLDFDEVIRNIQRTVHIQIVGEIRMREAAGAAAEQELLDPGGFIPEFQHGGQFTVGGKPGVDQNLVAFRASRGEVVTVTPTSNVDNRSVNMGDINMGGGGMSPQTFDRMIRSWMGA